MLAYFRKPTAQTLMVQELADAQCALLLAHSGLEWATAQVAYNKARVARLRVDVALAEQQRRPAFIDSKPSWFSSAS